MSSNNEKLESNSAIAFKQFAFRPSKLTAVAEKIWKKEPSNSSVTKPQTPINIVEKPKFTCASPESKNCETSTSSTAAKFVFGQNIKQRVVNSEEASSSNSPLNVQLNDSKVNTKVDDFKAIICKTEKESKHQSTSQENGTEVSLEQSAEKYEKTKCENLKVKLAENVEVKTGEEEEFNILKVSCKLHVYDNADQTWKERGEVFFRLNEDSKSDEDDRARIVVRLQGSLKVVINSRLWDKMLVQRVTPKRLKLSAIDATDKTVVLYLISGLQSDIEKIEHEVTMRLDDLKHYSSKQNAVIIKRPNTDLDDDAKSDEKKPKTTD